jgi:beta-phosphoglucomutase-like phosphatase (HAD superfamily)
MKVDLAGGRFDAVLFDLDGVLTDTARLHAASWKRMFDAFLRRRAEATGEPFRPFEMEDYGLYVDGRPRYDGVRDFLKSRGIELPEGGPEDPTDRETVCGLGNRKNEMVTEVIKSVGVDAYPGSVALVRYVRDHGLRTAVVSATAPGVAWMIFQPSETRTPDVTGSGRGPCGAKL